MTIRVFFFCDVDTHLSIDFLRINIILENHISSIILTFLVALPTEHVNIYLILIGKKIILKKLQQFNLQNG